MTQEQYWHALLKKKQQHSTVIGIISHTEAHKRGKDDERTRVRKRSASREQKKPDAASGGSEGSSGMKGMGKLGPRGSRLWPKERAEVWSTLMGIIDSPKPPPGALTKLLTHGSRAVIQKLLNSPPWLQVGWHAAMLWVIRHPLWKGPQQSWKPSRTTPLVYWDE